MNERSDPDAGVMAPGRVHGLLTEIIGNSNDAIITKDLFGVVTSWNGAAEQLFGFSAPEMIGQPITRIIPPGREEEEPAILERMRRGERLSHFETQRLTRDGRTIDVSVTIVPIRDSAGRVVGISKIARDLTETHRLGADLTRQAALLQSVLEAVPDALIVIDRDGLVQSFSPAAERIFGWGAAEIIGRNVRLLMPAADASRHDAHLAQYLTTRERHIIGIGRALVGRRRDGGEFPMELQVGEVIVAGAHLFTGFVRDLTERREREQRMAELQAELIHVSRLNDLGHLVSALTHEVNQPLTAISNYLRGIRRLLPAEAAPMLREAVDKAAVQATRAHDILQSLRSLVKKEARLHQPESLSDMIAEVRALGVLDAKSGISLQVAIAPEANAVMVDRVQIQQVLLNLLRNAADAMAEAPVRRLRVTASLAAERVEICVADSGPGLSAAVLSRMFQPFVTTKAEGLGVGLSICRTIVEAHGGRLTAGNQPGGGAVFCFTVPRAG